MKLAGFTQEQENALAAFESACASHDLNAFGHTRHDSAWRALAACYHDVLALGIGDALTAREHSAGKRALSA